MGQKPLISPGYREQNRLLHEQRDDYGGTGGRFAEHVYGLMAAWHPATVLDYGCGKGDLEPTVREMVARRKPRRPRLGRAKGGRHNVMGVTMPRWTSYDPAIPGLDVLPAKPFDMVVCTDVLEHVEPEYIDETISMLAWLTRRVALLTIALHESNKTLPDGRNAHLIVEDREWWFDHISEHFAFVSEVPWWSDDTLVVVALK